MDLQAMTHPPELNEKELRTYQTMADAVDGEAREVAASIVDLKTLKKAQVWCSERMTFARDLREHGWMSEIRDLWHKKHKDMCRMIKGFSDPHEKAVKDIVDPVINKWLAIMQEKAVLEESRRAEEARKQDEEIRLAQAQALARQGFHEEADKLLETPGEFIAPAAAPVKLDFMHQRVFYKVRELDEQQPGDLARKLEFINAVASGSVSMRALDINYSYLNRELEKTPQTFPGLELQEVTSNTHRRIA